MRKSHKLIPAVIAALGTFSGLNHAFGANVYWDPNGTGTSGAGTGTGTWDGTNQFWNTDLDGGSGTTSVDVGSGNIGVFSAGTDASGTFTVTLSGAQKEIAGLQLEEGNVTLTSGATIHMNGTTDTFDIAAGKTLTIAGVVSGTSNLSVVNNAGTLVLNNTSNSYTGTTSVSGGGKLSIAADLNLGPVPGSTVAGSITLDGGTLIAPAITISSRRGIAVGANGAEINGTGGGNLSYNGLFAATAGSGAVITKSGLTQSVTATSTTGDSSLFMNFAAGASGNTAYNGTWKITGGEVNPGNAQGAGGISLADLGWGPVPGSTVNNYFELSAASANTLSGLRFGQNASGTVNAKRGMTLAGFGGTITSVNAATTITFAGVIAGGSSSPLMIPATHVGTLALTGANNFTGGTTIYAGTVNAGSSSAFGTGPLAVNSLGTTATAVNLPTGSGLAVGSLSGSKGAASLTINTQTGRDFSINQTNDGTYAGVIAGGGSVTFSGSNTLNLTGINNYGGGTSVTGGTLRINNPSASGTGSGAVAVSGGTLAGGGSISGTVTVSGTGHVAPGNSIGTLTVGALTLQTASVLDMELGAALTSDKITAGTLTLNVGSSVNVIDAGMDTGLYTLINYTTMAGGPVGDLGTPTGPSGFTYALSDTGSAIQLTVSGNSWVLDDTSTNNNWSIGANWSTTTEPNAVGAVAVFGDTLPNNPAKTVNVDAAKTVGRMYFNSTSSYTVSGANSITIDTSGANGQIKDSNGSHLISAPITLNKSTDVTVINGGDTLTISGAIAESGARALSKAGAGTLVLSNTGNNYSGGTNINAGTLTADSANALGTSGNIKFAGGTLKYTANSASTDFSSRIVGSTSDIKIDTGGQSIVFASALNNSNTAGLTKSGSGTLALQGINAYPGATTINGGTVVVSNFSSLGAQNGSVVNISNATLQMTGGFGYGVGQHTFSMGSNAVIDLNGQSFDWSAAINGSAFTFISSVAGTNEFHSTGAIGAASFTLGANAILTGLNTGSLGNFGNGAPLSFDGGRLGFDLNVASSPGSPFNTLINQLNVSSNGGMITTQGRYAAGTLKIAYVTIPGPVVGSGTLTHRGQGGVTFTGSMTGFTGDLRVDPEVFANNTFGGTVSLKTDMLNVSGVTVTGPQSVLDLASDGTFNRMIKTPTATVTLGGQINLNDNKMVVTAMPAGTATGGVYASGSVSRLVQDGRNGGSWNGTGIVTSQTAAQGIAPLTTVAVATASDVGYGGTVTFGAQSVNAGDTLVMYTYAGDTTLDGQINGDDYFRIDSVYPGSTGYENGDLNYDGVVNADDYFIIDKNYGNQTLGIFPHAPLPGGVSAVPEPGSLGLLLLAGSTLVRRRRSAK